jgi:hypothetical protein
MEKLTQDFSPKAFKILENNRSHLKISFDGKEIDRDSRRSDFVKFFKDYLENSFDFPSEFIPTIVILCVEMVKNDYDHDDGRGTFEIHKNDNDDFSMTFAGNGTESFDIESLRNRESWIKKNDYNRNVGINSIFEIAESMNLKIDLDTDPGLKYTITGNLEMLEKNVI